MINCPLCSGPMEPWHASNMGLVSCRCGFISVDLNTWEYPFSERDYYAEADLSIAGSIAPFIAHRVRILKKYLTSGTVADLGCGSGATTIALARGGYTAIGIDESPKAIEFLQSNFAQAKWVNASIPEYLREPTEHDGMALYHVLEHIPNPTDLCQLMKQRLRVNGILVIEVPDVQSGQARLYGKRWGMYIPDHVNYFTSGTLRRLLEPMGFELIQCERKYHFAWPSGMWLRDITHAVLAGAGLHSIISTCWRRV